MTPKQAVFDAVDSPSPALIDKCVHCGFCLPSCPTYILWGEEMDSPRGRIYLMKAGLEGRADMTSSFVKHFDACLGLHGVCDGLSVRCAVRSADRANPGANRATPPTGTGRSTLPQRVVQHPSALRDVSACCSFPGVFRWCGGGVRPVGDCEPAAASRALANEAGASRLVGGSDAACRCKDTRLRPAAQLKAGL